MPTFSESKTLSNHLDIHIYVLVKVKQQQEWSLI